MFPVTRRPGITESVLVIAAALVLSTGGCAGKSVAKVENIAELPKELQEKFEVKDSTIAPAAPGDASAAAAAPKAEVIPAAPVKGKRGKKDRAKPAVAKPSEKTSAKPAEKTDEVVAPGFQYPSRRPPVEPIWPTERHVFEISYFGVAAGDFTMEVLPFKTVADRKVYHVRGTAVSSALFSMFYRLNDTVETFIDYDGLFSHRFHLLLDETKQSRDALELYDSEKRQTFYWNRWNRKEKGYVENKEYFPIEPFSQDMLSSLYYLRTIPLPTGAVITFPVVSEGRSWDAVVTVVRREMIDTPLGRVAAVVLKPETKLRGVLQKSGDSFLWLTDDQRRFVVRLEAKVKIGTVVAALKSIHGGIRPDEASDDTPAKAPEVEPSPAAMTTER